MNSRVLRVRVPAAGVRVSPAGGGLRVEVIEPALHHAGIQKKPLDPIAPPLAPGVGGFTVDMKLLTHDLHPGGIRPEG
jgi:hypothetical protein